MANKSLKLNNGMEIPTIGLGTSLINDAMNKELIKKSIDLGYRLFDTAFVYANEEIVGEGIKEKLQEGSVKREDLFVVTKLWNTKHKLEDVVPMMKRSLQSLQLSYVDLYLIHWPFAQKQIAQDEFKTNENPEEDIPIEETWKGMEQCVKLGYARSIGISNFNTVQIERILKVAEIKPVVNQVECNPYMNQEKLREFCKQRGIVIMAYSPFYARNRLGFNNHGLNLFEEPIIKKIAEKYKKTTSQIVLRYLTQCDVVPIPKSSNVERLKLNIDIFDFTLTTEEFDQMRSLNKNLRCSEFVKAKEFKEYPFKIEY